MDLGVAFPSPEWLEHYAQVLNSSAKFVEATRGWVWVILFVVEDQGSCEGFILEIADGSCRRHVYLKDARDARAPYRVWAARRVWLDLLAGSLDPTLAIGQAKVRLLANQATLGRFAETVKVLLSHMRYTLTCG